MNIHQQYRKLEWGIKNYLNKHNICKDNDGMQTIIINSFYNERGQRNEDDWYLKLSYIDTHFGLFAQYAQNNWKISQTTI